MVTSGAQVLSDLVTVLPAATLEKVKVVGEVAEVDTLEDLPLLATGFGLATLSTEVVEDWRLVEDEVVDLLLVSKVVEVAADFELDEEVAALLLVAKVVDMELFVVDELLAAAVLADPLPSASVDGLAVSLRYSYVWPNGVAASQTPLVAALELLAPVP